MEPINLSPPSAPATPAPSTNKLKALQNLRTQMPAASQKVAEQMQAGQALQVRQAVAAQPQTSNIQAAAAPIGAAAAAQSGQQALQQAGQMQQANQQISSLAVGAQQQANQAQLAGASLGVGQEQLEGRARLANLSEQAATELYDARTQFQKDEMGRTFMNQRQLADFAKSQATSDQQFQNYAQKAQQVQKDSARIQTAAYEKLASALQDQQKLVQMGYNKQQIQELADYKRALQAKLEKDKADAAAKSGLWSTVGGIGGAVVGAFAGGPAGAVAGYSVGSGLGRAASSQS